MQATLYAFTCPFCQHSVTVPDVNEGEVITCTNPACQKKFEADLPKVLPDAVAHAEPELIVPPGVRETAVEPPAPETPKAILAEEPETIQPAAVVPGSDKEETVAVFRSPMFGRFPGHFLLYLGIMAFGLWLIYNGWAYQYSGLMWFGLIPLAFGLWRFGYWWLDSAHASVTLTTRGIVIHEGILSGVTREIYHKTVSNIHIFQPWYCRPFHAGSVVLVWGDKKEEVELESVQHPHRLVELIRKYAEEQPAAAGEAGK